MVSRFDSHNLKYHVNLVRRISRFNDSLVNPVIKFQRLRCLLTFCNNFFDHFVERIFGGLEFNRHNYKFY